MNAVRPLEPAAILIVVIGGCSAGDAPALAQASVTDSAGATIVSNVGEGTFGRMRAVERLRLGRIDGDGPKLFTRIRALALGGDGTVYVGDNGTRTVRVFTAGGEFETEFGGYGQGPREVTTIDVLLVAGDTVVVVDYQAGGKILRFLESGQFVDDMTLWTSSRASHLPLARAPDGWLVLHIPPFAPARLAFGEAWKSTSTIHLMQFGADSLGPALYELPSYGMYGLGGGGREIESGLFRPDASIGFDALGQMYTTRHDAYEVQVHRPEGLRRVVRRDVQPRYVQPQDVEDVKTAALQVFDATPTLPGDRVGQRRDLIEQLDTRARLPIPEVVPPLGQLLVSRDGSFWVERRDKQDPARREAFAMFSGSEDVPPEPTTWDLFDPTGFHLGEVELPDRFRAEAVDGRFVVGVWMDDLDVEYVLRIEAVPVR